MDCDQKTETRLGGDDGGTRPQAGGGDEERGGVGFSFRVAGGAVTEFEERQTEFGQGSWGAFGEDSSGELHLCDLAYPRGGVFRVVRGCYANCDGSAAPTATSPPLPRS
jgi:hypothetical protein